MVARGAIVVACDKRCVASAGAAAVVDAPVRKCGHATNFKGARPRHKSRRPELRRRTFETWPPDFGTPPRPAVTERPHS